MSRYALVRTRGTAGELHARPLPDPLVPTIWWHEVTAPAIVLGSSPHERLIDAAACRRAGVEVVRRRSGGGAVLVTPGDTSWIDVIVPRGAPGWHDDVHRPMTWLGEHLAALLAGQMTALGRGGDLAVFPGPYRPSEWSRLLCYAGLGSGEITLDGAKLVGISQRRTRHAARLQCSWYAAHDQAVLLTLLDPAQCPPLDTLDAHGPVATLPRAVTDPAIDALAGRLDGPARSG
jgi:lipoate-protein ligase A